MNHQSILLISAFMFLFGAVKAQETQKITAPINQYVSGSHGGILFTEGINTMEFLKKNKSFVVFPDDHTTQTAEVGTAKFTIVDDNKTIVIENVPFKSGMFMADSKQDFVHPKIKFETIINGKPCVMNFEMPSRQ